MTPDPTDSPAPSEPIDLAAEERAADERDARAIVVFFRVVTGTGDKPSLRGYRRDRAAKKPAPKSPKLRK